LIDVLILSVYLFKYTIQGISIMCIHWFKYAPGMEGFDKWGKFSNVCVYSKKTSSQFVYVVLWSPFG